MKGKVRHLIRKGLRFFLNPRLLLCGGIAWIITNGWSYILLALGVFLDITWMKALGGGYMAFLWFPMTPEKILTVMIAIGLLRRFFPDDEDTLAVLRESLAKVKSSLKRKKTGIQPE
ncbi:MAG: hypothetical protein IJO79_04690 [Firmicutes bacterium]|nr:hypothetical protein [Bacillota bacterium]